MIELTPEQYAIQRTKFLKEKSDKMSKRERENWDYLNSGYGRSNVYSNRSKR